MLVLNHKHQIKVFECPNEGCSIPASTQLYPFDLDKDGQEFSDSLLFLEVNTAGSLCDVFRFGPWVFSAIHGAEGVYFADGFALGVKFKPGADIGKFAAGATAETLAPAFA